MPTLSTVGDLLMLWLFLGAAIVLMILAVRTTGVEREEGLPRSKYRIPFAAAVCALVGLLVILSTFSAFRPPRPSSESGRAKSDSQGDLGTRANTEKQPAAIPEELSRLEQQREQLRKDLEKIEEQIRKMSKSRPEETKEPDKEKTDQPKEGAVSGEAASGSFWSRIDFR
jgi:flagellar biosynthesis/type III secretory pathway M-ring protein FliF/YscJ